MILIQPVNWDRVVSSVATSLATASTTKLDIFPSIRLLNFGPGTGLMRSTQKAFEIYSFVCVDLTSGDTCGNGDERKAKQEPIAIVGMAVNMPGAPNTAGLWEVLERGINTCSEVTRFLCHFYAMLTPFPRMYRSQKVASKSPTTPIRPIQNQLAHSKPTPATSFLPLPPSTTNSLTFLHAKHGVWILNNACCYILLTRRLRMLVTFLTLRPRFEERILGVGSVLRRGIMCRI
jgi:hypothetical protein